MNTTIFTNGRIYTGDPQHLFVQAMVVKDGLVHDLGTDADMTLQWGKSDTRIIDLQGCTATPGLIDSHLHLGWLGLTFLQLDLTKATSKDEMLYLIKQKAEQTPPNEWIQGFGWDENLFVGGGGIPTLEELDLVAPHCPILLSRICGHANLVNSKALELSNYHPDMAVPAGGVIVHDPVTGKPTGMLLETASNLITPNIPKPSYDSLKQALRGSVRYAMEHGLTGAHTEDCRDLHGLAQTYRLYDELINGEELALRCNLLVYYPNMHELRDLGMHAGYGNSHVNIGAVKIFADGALGRRTAYLGAPYADDPTTCGYPVHEQEALTELVRQARELHMPIAVHTIGDKALEMVLDSLDQFAPVAYRDRLIHTQILRPDLLDRLAVPHRIADIQPRFLAGDFPWVMDRVGEERIQHSYIWKTMMERGIICAAGSDTPVEPIDPLLGIHAAVTRKAPGDTHGGYLPHEKLTMQEAIHLFTLGSATVTNEDHVKGTLSRGKFADMTVYSHDLFSIDPDELLSTKVVMTVIGGHVRYSR
ncbi:hydrolase [Brevibacillus choshinensis]|uniref:Hydrolase n=1 Tax=Brevibacillus choshinensis TaxID=54911 RepID=A0ABR5N1Y0_BRECH|nr:amidohydrolase [Brevibacillus choshinensis]KQL44281.1 hydrolase [Brevibacillus choshinensis]